MNISKIRTEVYFPNLNSQKNTVKGIIEENPSDCTVIIQYTPNTKKCILIDTGKKGQGKEIIIPFLISKNINYIDYIWISHFHFDHFGGLGELIDCPDINIGAIAYTPISDNLIEKGDDTLLSIRLWKSLKKSLESSNIDIINIYNCFVGCVFKIGKYMNITILNTQDYDYTGVCGKNFNTNCTSMVIMIEVDNFKMIFAGDAYSSQLDNIAEDFNDELNGTFLYKVPHHGGPYSLSEKFTECCCPEIIVVTCNRALGLSYTGLEDNLKYYANSAKFCLRTDKIEDISIIIENGKYELRY
jgi:metallo-beta-lactamase superfamily